MIQYKKCPFCQESKYLEEFSKDKTTRDKVCVYCKACCSIKRKLYRNSEKGKTVTKKYANSFKYWNIKREYDRSERGKEIKKASFLKRKYGITKDQIKKYCEICKIEKYICVDHCHKTGKFRGTLCKICNAFLSRIDANPENLTNLITYVQRFKNE